MENFLWHKVFLNVRVDDELSANHFGQSESSDGTRVTGEYRVLLPDGRTQIVK